MREAPSRPTPTGHRRRRTAPALRQPVFLPGRLRDELARGLDAGFLYLQAPAGCGKTAAVLQFLLERELDPHWYSCTQEDCDPQTLLAGIVRALGGGETPGGQTALAAVASRDVRGPARAALKPFLDEFASNAGQTGVLVIDDADVVRESPASGTLDDAIAELSRFVRVVLISRADLALSSQAKRLLDGSAVRISAESLLLREDEIAACAREAYNVSLTQGESAALYRVTAGWGIALRLALRLRDLGAAVEPGGGAFDAQARTDLFTYLATEVLKRADDRVVRFLRRTAVLETLDPEVCAQLAGEERPVELLQALAGAGLPVMKAGWNAYRCHSLLREFLLSPLSAAERCDAERAAGRAYERVGDWPHALDHYAAGGDASAALGLADERGRDLFYAGGGRALVDLVKNAPRELLDAHHRAEYWAAFAAARIFQLDWAAAAFDRAHRNATAAGDTVVARDALAALAQLLNGWGRFPAATAVAQQLLDSLPAEDRATRGAITLGYLVTGMGGTSQFREAVALIRELLPQLSSEPRADAGAEAYARAVAAVTLAMEGDFAAARAEINMANVLILGRELGDIHTFVPWSSALVEFMAANPDGADAAALSAETLALRFGDLQRVLECRALRASTATMRGHVDEADRGFAQLDELRGGGGDYWGFVLALLSRPERARLHGDVGGALAAAEANHALAVSLSGARFVCSTRLDVSYFRLLNGDADGAREHARTAVSEANALSAGLLTYGAHLMLAAASPEDELSAMAEALRIAEARDFRFLMPYAVRLPQLDAALWRALATGSSSRAAVLLNAAGPPTVRAFREVASGLGEGALLEAIPLLKGFGAAGRQALRDLRTTAPRTVSAEASAALSALEAANPHGLSDREREVLRLLSCGLRTKEIAEQLVVTPATVSTHIQRIMSKTSTDSRAALLALAARESPGEAG